MTMLDFLAQAGFWQWIGIIVLFYMPCQAAIIIAHALSKRQKRDNEL